MSDTSLSARMDDHALEPVPPGDRQNWLKITWNTAGIVTTLVILFLGALVCFVAGVKIALLAGFIAFSFGTLIGWGLAHIAFTTGYSNTLVTRRHGLGVKGSALASVIFGFLILGMLALENALLYRGFLFFFDLNDSVSYRLLIYGGLTLAWIVLTAFGFALVARFSSVMLIAFLAVLAWVLGEVLVDAGRSLGSAIIFPSQLPEAALAEMGVVSDWDKFVFSINILIGPACALPLVAVDYGRYAVSTRHAVAAVAIGGFFQTVLVMLVGGVLMYASAAGLAEFFVNTRGMTPADAGQAVLQSPDSIAAAFMVFGGVVGFGLMLIAQSKAQVLNCYSASLALTNLFDALFNWRPGRFFFVVLGNLIALTMLYGHILELVDQFMKLIGVLLSSLSGIILLDYFLVGPRLRHSLEHRPGERTDEAINWAGVSTVVLCVVFAHYILKPYMPVEVLSSIAVVVLAYPTLRLFVLRPSQTSV
jgi:cytosine permease